jgi:hypothetical protein
MWGIELHAGFENPYKKFGRSKTGVSNGKAVRERDGGPAFNGHSGRTEKAAS